MDDTLFGAFVEWIVELTDDRAGRPAAWAVAALMLLVPMAGVAYLMWSAAR